jgi:hypothetical protein
LEKEKKGKIDNVEEEREGVAEKRKEDDGSAVCACWRWKGLFLCTPISKPRVDFKHGVTASVNLAVGFSKELDGQWEMGAVQGVRRK